MRDYLTLGSAPVEENCVQVEPTGNYIQPMKEECKKYKELLEKLFHIPEELRHNTYFTVKRFDHDFGGYYEVCIVYDDSSEESTDIAFSVENNLPNVWNQEEV